MATKKEVTVEDKLRALYDLQLIDSRVDEIRNVRGELPLEVEDLEDEVSGLNTRMEKLKSDLETINVEIAAKKNLIEDAKSAIKKYAEQQKNVRNSREFNALSKEVEFQELEIELAEKNIREFKAQMEQKKAVIEDSKERLEARETHLKHKKEELNDILAETEKEEKALELKERIEVSEAAEWNLNEKGGSLEEEAEEMVSGLWVSEDRDQKKHKVIKIKNLKATKEQKDAKEQKDGYETKIVVKRKANSWTAEDKNQPLIVIDGKIMEKGKNLNEIDPDGIESINVLKGKPAKEKYGNKGINGVIEIVTKKE